MAEVTISVPEISCGHCKDTIETAVLAVPGVRTALVDVTGRQVTVGYDGPDLAPVTDAIADAGYEIAAVAG